MPNKIQVLDLTTVNKIAAGEVIERPASVVKELIENSLDAGAQRIDVFISGAGLKMIRVSDNGCGMSPGDAELAFERHATSKISRFEDLRALRTLGFRGEALPSIAAVAEVEIFTREEEEAEVGTRLVVRHGKIISKGEIAREPGTTVSVRGLFSNVPARLKYLRSARTETAHIVDVVARISLARPDVGFCLSTETKEILRTRGDGSLHEAIAAVLGRRQAQQMVPVAHRAHGIELSGYISKPALTRSDPIHQTLVVNSRPFASTMIPSAIMEGYGSLLMRGRHPVAVLCISIPPAEVDVNVHPTKREVRFRDDVAVYESIREAVSAALAEADLIPTPEVRGVVESTEKPFPPAPRHAAQSKLRTEEITSSERIPASPWTVVGQIMNTYILLQRDDGLEIIDQHAAHERIVFEQLRCLDRGAEQRLIEPRAIELEPMTMELLDETLPLLIETGFDIERFGEDTVLVRGIPVVSGALEAPERLSDLITEIARLRRSAAEEHREEVLRLIACHSAVRAGEPLERAAMEKIVEGTERLPSGKTCPHGRPTRVRITRAELERMFGRRG
ncbi:MAG: DNA mismatch repair endonuclease MutL [Candidatus Thermoplasmatota archaeon]